MVLNIGLAYNIKKTVNCGDQDGIYAEYDDEHTIASIKSALESFGHNVVLVEADDNFFNSLLSTRFDIVFNIAEGLRGESRESHVPAMCEMLGIPYTGSGPLTLAICLNKARTKEILNQYNIPTPKHQVFKTPEDTLDKEMKYPLIVKPLHEGSSIGVGVNSVVRNNIELVERVCRINVKHKQPAIVERFLSGREFTVAVIGNKKPYTLPVIEILLNDYPLETREVYSFEAKTMWDRDSYSGPVADAGDGLEGKLTGLALRAHKALDCRDFSRIDIRMDDNERLNVIEVNPLPGLNPRVEAVSYFPKAARMAGIQYKDLIGEMLSRGVERYSLKEREVLRSDVKSGINIQPH